MPREPSTSITAGTARPVAVEQVADAEKRQLLGDEGLGVEREDARVVPSSSTRK